MKASSFCYVPFVIRLVAILILMFVGSAVLGQANPVPFINLPFVPTSTAPGGPSFTLTVNGAGFVSGSVVMWNTTALTTTSISSTQLTATVPAADITTAGTAGITVTSPSPGGGTSSVVFSPVSGKATSIGFVNSQILQSAEIPVSITTGDFNGDGRVDLAAVNNAGSVSIFIGNGDGSFQPNVDYPTIAGANGIVAVDLLSNGSLDLVTVAPGTIAVLRGNGDGSFQTHVAYPGDQPTCGIDGGLVGGSIVAGDFNGDGKIDLAASWGCYHGVGGSVDGVTSVFLGNGDGTFQPYISNSVVPLDQAIAAGDFNLDGILDLAGSVPTCHSDCPETADLAVGNGDGTFTSTFGGLDSGLETYWPFVAAADINGDGNLDFVVCNKSDFSTLLGNGDGTAQSPIGAGSGCTSVALGDFHGNGYLDLIMSVPYNSAGTQMFPGNGTGQFPAGEPVPSPSHQSAGSVVAGDFNGDGRLDVAVASPDKTIWIDLQASLGSLSPTSASFSAPVTMNSAPQPVVLSNLSGLPIVISTITISAHFSQTNNCPLGGSLPPTASCTINVTFEPMDSGDTAGTLSITNSGLVTPLSASRFCLPSLFCWRRALWQTGSLPRYGEFQPTPNRRTFPR